MRVAFDSNILLYLAKVWKVDADRHKTGVVESLIMRFDDAVEPTAPFQALGESYRIMLRFGFPRDVCRTTVLRWSTRFTTVSTSEAAFLAAIDLATDHKLEFWDALIVSVAAEAGCTLFLSEDLQPGFTWRGVTVVNPLAETLDARLVRILDAPR